MSRKIAGLLATTVVMVSLLTACQGNQDGNAVNNNAQPDAVSDGLPSGNVSLRVWGAEEDKELMDEIINNFVSENSSKASISISFEGVGEANCKDELLGDVLNAPDVFVFPDDQLRGLIASGVLKPVPNASEISSRNLAASSEAASVNGTLYAYPLTADNGYFLYYNKEYVSDEDTASMDSLLSAIEQSEKKFFMEMTSGWYLYSFFGNTDMEIGLNDDGISTFLNWNAKYTDIKGSDVAEGMLNIAKSPAFTASYEGGFAQGVMDGTIVAGVSGVWDEATVKENWGDNYAACKLPTYTVAGSQIQMASYAGYKLVGVNSYSDNYEWACEFADYMTNEKNQTLRFEKRGQGPSNTNASGAGEIGQSKAIQALQQQAEFSSLQRVGGDYWDPSANFGTIISEGNPNGVSLQDLLNDMVTGITGEVSTGDLPGEEVPQESQEVVQEETEETTEENSENTEETEQKEVSEQTT